MMHLVPFTPTDAEWARLDTLPDRTLFQTRAWVEFIAETQGAQPVVAALRDGDEELGYFTGLLVRRLGMPILGSPFRGWTTSYMGFNLLRTVPMAAALTALERLAFGTLHCVHLEVMDRRWGAGIDPPNNFARERLAGYEIDLRPTPEAMFGAMSSACRRNIRKAERSGVRVEACTDGEFARDYYAQLADVFAKQRLVPTYGVARVHALIRRLGPTGRLLLLRARDTDGRCIATGIFPAFNGTAFFWGGASWRWGQHLRPNELLQWYAMQYWRERGMHRFDLGGGGAYKKKYGGRPIAVPWLRASRFSLVAGLRDRARRFVKLSQRLAGRARQ